MPFNKSLHAFCEESRTKKKVTGSVNINLFLCYRKAKVTHKGIRKNFPEKTYKNIINIYLSDKSNASGTFSFSRAKSSTSFMEST